MTTASLRSSGDWARLGGLVVIWGTAFLFIDLSVETIPPATLVAARVSIAAAVLGGCSLRGGEGTILGVVIGAALMRVLKNMITLVDWMPTYIEYAIIGAVILAGVMVDELLKRASSRRRLQRIRAEAGE